MKLLSHWLEYPTGVRKVLGSIPPGDSGFFLCALLVTCSSNFTCNESDYNEENLLSSRITIFVRHMQSSTFDPRFTLKSPSFAIPGVFGNLGV